MEWWRNQFVALIVAVSLGGGCLFRPIMVPSGPGGDGGHGGSEAPTAAEMSNSADAGVMTANTADQGAGGSAGGSNNGAGRDGRAAGFEAPGASQRPCSARDLEVFGGRVICNDVFALPDGSFCDLSWMRDAGNRNDGAVSVGPSDAGVEDGSEGLDGSEGSDASADVIRACGDGSRLD